MCWIRGPHARPGTWNLERGRADDSGGAQCSLLALSQGPVAEVFDILSPAHDRHPEQPPHGAQARLRVVAFVSGAPS